MQFADIKNDIAFRHTWTKADLDAYEYARIRETDDKAEKMLVEQNAKFQEKIEIAKNMITDNEPNEKIFKYTGLSSEQIELLRSHK